MLKEMRAVVTPQGVVNNCLDAVRTSGLEANARVKVLNNLSISHFTFVVEPDDYEHVSGGLLEMGGLSFSGDVSPGNHATMNIQEVVGAKSLVCWYHGHPIAGVSVVTSTPMGLEPGGGYVSVYAPSLQASYNWLKSHDVAFEVVDLYGVRVLSVPLSTSDWGVGAGYYGLVVTTEPLVDTVLRLNRDVNSGA